MVPPTYSVVKVTPYLVQLEGLVGRLLVMCSLPPIFYFLVLRVAGIETHLELDLCISETKFTIDELIDSEVAG